MEIAMTRKAKAIDFRRGGRLYSASALLLMLFLLAACAAPGGQRALGDGAGDDTLTGHRYLGPIQARDIGPIELGGHPPMRYRMTETGEPPEAMVVERRKLGATIRESQTFITDDAELTLMVTRATNGPVYGVDLESVEMASGEPFDEEEIRELQSSLPSIGGALGDMQSAVLGKPLVVGELYVWDINDSVNALVQSLADAAGDPGMTFDASSRYLGITRTAEGEAAVFRDVGSGTVDMDGGNLTYYAAGWRLIDRDTGALIEQDWRMKTEYPMSGQTQTIYSEERIELVDD